MTHTPHTPSRPRLGAAAAWALAGALLFAQCLGLAHGVLHTGHDAHAHAQAGTAFDGHAADHDSLPYTAALFGHGDDDASACRLLDHASVADLQVGGPLPEPRLAAASLALPAPQFGGVSAYAASYRARAPPKAA